MRTVILNTNHFKKTIFKAAATVLHKPPNMLYNTSKSYPTMGLSCLSPREGCTYDKGCLGEEPYEMKVSRTVMKTSREW